MLKESAKYALLKYSPHYFIVLLLRFIESRHNQVTGKIRKELGVKPLKEFDLSKYKNSETVFILGSGSSINNIPDDRWENIREKDSFGFNFWMRHKFVPTIYFFEFSPNPTFKKLCDIAKEREEAYLDIPKILISHLNYSPKLEYSFNMLPQSWKKDTYTCNAYTTIAKNRMELDKAITTLKRKGIFSTEQQLNGLFKCMGTMTSLISMAAIMQYRNIVLCGIDLSNPAYFYGDPILYPDMNGFRSSAPTKRHVLLADDVPYCGGDIVIYKLQELILKPLNISIYVENSNSALYPTIPLAPSSLYQ